MPGQTHRPRLLDEQLHLDPDLAPSPTVPSPDADPSAVAPASTTPTLDLLHIDPSLLLGDDEESGPNLMLDVPEYRQGLRLPFLEGTPLEGIGHDVETWSQDPMQYTRDQDTEVNRQRADADESARQLTERADIATGNPNAWEVTGGSVPVLSF